MSIKFSCVKCGHHLKTNAEQAGKTGKCTRCGQPMTVPVPPPLAVAAAGPSETGPVGGNWRSRRVLFTSLATAVLVGGIILAIFLYIRAHVVDQKLSDLTGDASEARTQALLWLAEASPQDARRTQVTASLEPLIFEGDARGNLDPDLVLRAYLHWAGQDNVPSLIRLVGNAHLPGWDATKIGRVMQTLGKLQDARAADVLARKLDDPNLRDQAVDALKLMGPGAENAVLDYLFADDPATRQRAGDLLADYGTAPQTVIAAARRRLESNDPQEQRVAAEWFADNPPDRDAEKDAVAGPLVGLLGDLSPETNGAALGGLKLWATKDSLPQVVEFARRLEKAGNTKEVEANKSALIDVLAQFPDTTAAEAIALQLKDPGLRDKAAQALVKLGPVASGTVLTYLNHPDENARKEAGSLCRLLNIPADRQLGQTLADVADTRKVRSRTALERLARLRPDEANRAEVSKGLNAPLLDTDAEIRDDALDAVRVWATPDNTATLLKLLGTLHGGPKERDGRTGEKVAQALISIGPGVEDSVVPLLKSSEGLARREACRILTEVGTEKSVQPL
ncbi:MAG TPA: hypothetical protein VGG61_16280, partial [Gemmataceae bacterium]